MGKYEKQNNSNYIVQGSILAAASIIARIIGLIYRIPVTNIIGDKGNDYYSCAFEVYSIILLISSYSLPLAVSKLVSAKVALGQHRNAFLIFKSALYFAVVVGIIGGLLTFFGADFFTGTMLNTPNSALSLKVLAPTILIVAVMGVMRGYFQGLGTMMPTAVSQVVEQIINAVVSVAAASYLFAYGAGLDAKNGITDGLGGEIHGAAGSTLGTGMGALAGLLFLVLVMFLYNRSLQRKLRMDRTRNSDDYATVFQMLFLTIIPVILSTAIYNVSGIIDQGIFKYLTIDVQNMDSDTVSTFWGVFTGRYKLLTNVPIAIASALSASTIPALTRARIKGDADEMRSKTDGAIRMVMIISIPCAVGFSVLAGPILQLLFGDFENLSIASHLLQAGSIAVVFYGLSTLTNGILQGIDQMKLPVRHAVIALVSHVVLLVVLILGFDLNIYGILYSYLFFAMLMCILNGISIRKHLEYKQEIKRTFFIPVVSSTIMGISVWLIYDWIHEAAGVKISCLVCILAAVIIYAIFILFLQGITEEELLRFPKGRAIVGLLKKVHLI